MPIKTVAPAIKLNVLNVTKWAISANNIDETEISYTTNDAVSFVVDNKLFEINPINQVATLRISADAAGQIVVQIEGRVITIAAYEVTTP